MEIKNYPLKTTPTNTDKLLIQDSTDNAYKSITLSALIPSNNFGLAPWTVKSANTTAISGERIIANTNSADITITLPASPSSGNEIEIINISATFKTVINFGNSKLDNLSTVNKTIALKGAFNYVKLVYFNSTSGWIQLPQKTLSTFTLYPTGMRLLLEFGSFQDQSGFNNNPITVNKVLPDIATGLDNQKVLRFNGSGTQELEIPYFMSGTTAATLYCVFTVSSTNNYNLIRTANLDDYWRFVVDNNGYMGTFLSSRKDVYPASMPSDGSHLISIHASASGHEVILDKVSKGAISNAYFSGDRFTIATNDKAFQGDIALILVYPSLISKTSATHTSILSLIKTNYPSLPFTA